MRSSLVATLVISCLAVALAQTQSPPPRPKETGPQALAVARAERRPPLSLQQALTSAEQYIGREHIDVSSYYLEEARLISYGDKKATKVPCWLFRWTGDGGESGKYVELLVFMDGGVLQTPSL